MRGDIDGDLVIDHLCRNRLCINIDHLELVTNQTNLQRSPLMGRRGGGESHCNKHGREDGAMRPRKGGGDRWVCKICTRTANAAYRARQAAA